MRIIAGSDKGRKLRTLAGHRTRPTPARLRESLFSILPGLIALPGARVLDLFAGSGALGLEALSRGAPSASFVEQDRQAQAILRANAAPFGARAQVLAMASHVALAKLAGQEFSLIFLDPPYQTSLLNLTLATLVKENFVTAGGIIVCEHHAKGPSPQLPAGVQQITERTCSDVRVILVRA